LFDGITKREALIIAALILIGGALTAWGAVYVTRTYVLARDYDEPLTRQSGPTEQNVMQAK
jgi:hypothetical protein